MDVGYERGRQHRINIRGQNYGYIVSHRKYPADTYQPNLNSSLIFQGISSHMIRFHAEVLDLEWDLESKYCYDYLAINSPTKRCRLQQFPVSVSLPTAVDELAIRFITDIGHGKEGFWLRYEGMFGYYKHYTLIEHDRKLNL